MNEGSKFILYFLLGVTGLWLLLFLLSLGPIGWFAIVAFVVGTMAYSGWSGDDETELDRTNCADCGAPNGPDRETCKHCDTRL